MTNYHVVYATYRRAHAEEKAARYPNSVLRYTPHSGWEVRIPVD
jgi:hypothetical protein